MVLWAIQDGGYDPSTWYWGALVVLAVLTAVGVGARRGRLNLSRPTTAALVALALYVAWSFLSISWASSPGDALEGSNRALLYLLVFALMAVLPWTTEGAVVALVTFVLGVGAIAVVMLFRLASANHVEGLLADGRFLAPTGYFNSNVALFTIAALTATALATRRGLPGLLRGVLLALATASLQLAVLGQSRGWLFTLPLVLIAAFVVVSDRLRVALAAVVPVAGTLIVMHRLLDVYHTYVGKVPLARASSLAGHGALRACAVVLLLGTLLAWADGLVRLPAPSVRMRRVLGAALVLGALVVGIGGGLAATHGHPGRFIARQWHGFIRSAAPSRSQSNFGVVGSGRYDFWRVSLDALLAHPIGGLGQDNFGDYYVTRRRTIEEPAWTHSLEMRLVAHTGMVGLLAFGGFLIAALMSAVRSRRSGSELARFASGAAMLPVIVWAIHGSVDWFWEMPALTGPALAFLAVAGAIGPRAAPQPAAGSSAATGRLRLGGGFAGRGLPRGALVLAATAAVLAATFVLGVPYLSAREVSVATAASARDPSGALDELKTAAQLDPLTAVPGRIGGTIALRMGQFAEAERRFRQAIAREPGGWFAWLGDGLAASELGDRARARHDFTVAASINSLQPAVTHALERVNTAHPLTPAQAFDMLLLHT